MHCRACDIELSNRESVRKSKTTGEYLDLCNRCFATIADVVPVIEKDVPEEKEEDPLGRV